jgi:hypothetical protein
MKKIACLFVSFLLAFSVHVTAQCIFKKAAEPKKSCCTQKKSEAKSVSSDKWIPFIETSYQLGLCSEENPVAFIFGAEKYISKHFSVTADVHAWKTDYAMMCDDVLSSGTYRAFIPSIKLKLDPGKKYKGFFISAGIGYAFAKDRGTDETFSVNATTGVKSSSVTAGNWDFNSISPNFSWGFAMKLFRFPVVISNTNYFAKTGWEGFEGMTPIATGVGLKLGLTQVKKTKTCARNQKTVIESKQCIKN